MSVLFFVCFVYTIKVVQCSFRPHWLSLYGLKQFFRMSPFVFLRKKGSQVLNVMRVSKWWQNFNFWMNYSFNSNWFTMFVFGQVIELFRWSVSMIWLFFFFFLALCYFNMKPRDNKIPGSCPGQDYPLSSQITAAFPFLDLFGFPFLSSL